jgi:hypothetical protein
MATTGTVSEQEARAEAEVLFRRITRRRDHAWRFVVTDHSPRIGVSAKDANFGVLGAATERKTPNFRAA